MALVWFGDGLGMVWGWLGWLGWLAWFEMVWECFLIAWDGLGMVLRWFWVGFGMMMCVFGKSSRWFGDGFWDWGWSGMVSDGLWDGFVMVLVRFWACL